MPSEPSPVVDDARARPVVTKTSPIYSRLYAVRRFTRHSAFGVCGAGWLGCNIALNRIPAKARIPVITTCSSGRESAHSQDQSQSRLTSAATIIIPPAEVRERFKRVKPLSELSVKNRGWTLDVLNAIHRLGKKEFTTNDTYVLERELAALHPDNRFVIPKIRQQLQKLRDLGLLLHIGRNRWRVK